MRELVDEIEELSKAADEAEEAIRCLDENEGVAQLCVYARGEYKIALGIDMGKKMLGIVLEWYQGYIAKAKNKMDILIEKLMEERKE